MLCELSYIYSYIFYFKNVLSTSLNIFRICEPVLASEHATKQHLMDCATPKFGRAHVVTCTKSLEFKIGRLGENRSSIEIHPFMEIPWYSEAAVEPGIDLHVIGQILYSLLSNSPTTQLPIFAFHRRKKLITSKWKTTK
jgi:hypothetical protein